MFLGDTPIFSMMKERMHWLADRQRVIAENVANADTPNYIARDLAEPDFGAMLRRRSSSQVLSAAQTDPQHFDANASGGSSSGSLMRRPDFETTPTGNSVVLEEQMIKAHIEGLPGGVFDATARSWICVAILVLIFMFQSSGAQPTTHPLPIDYLSASYLLTRLVSPSRG